MVGRWRRILVAVAIAVGAPAALAVVAASPAGATTATTFQLSPCPSSSATGNGSVAISQTTRSLTVVDRINNDLPDANDFVGLFDVTGGINQFALFQLSSKGTALFEVHQTTTLPTGVNRGDSIVAFDFTDDVVIMASDSANCGV